jgi:hypothetical protein
MRNKIFLPFIFLNFICLFSYAQSLTYSKPEREDTKLADFSIIGKLHNYYLIYVCTPSERTINIFDNQMKLIGKKEMNFLPASILGTDVIAYDTSFYFIYQYQKNNIINCAVAQMDEDGEIIGEPVILDTTKVNFTATNKIYNILYSENKQRIAIYKVNNQDKNRYFVSSNLFDGQLALLNKFSIIIPTLPEINFLSDFALDNEGNFAFVKAGDESESHESQLISLFVKSPLRDSLNIYLLDIGKLYLDNVFVKADNLNHHFVITSFLSKSKNWQTDGIYCAVWNEDSQSFNASKAIYFNEDFKKSLRYKGTISSFNNHHLRNIIIRRDGGFVITSESTFATIQGGGGLNLSYDIPENWDFTYTSNEHGYLHSSFSETSSAYEWPWLEPDPRISRSFYAYAIAIMSFDSLANMEWSNVIPKNQFGNNVFEVMGFGIYLTGASINFLFNQTVKKIPPLQHVGINASGKTVSTSILKGLNRHYIFMPLYIKQISAHEAIAPCRFGNQFCFAKIDF